MVKSLMQVLTGTLSPRPRYPLDVHRVPREGAVLHCQESLGSSAHLRARISLPAEGDAEVALFRSMQAQLESNKDIKIDPQARLLYDPR